MLVNLSFFIYFMDLFGPGLLLFIIFTSQGLYFTTQEMYQYFGFP